MIEESEFDLQWEGRRCRIAQLGSKASRGVARRVANTLGGALRELGANGGSLELDLSAAFVVALGGVMERMDDATLDWLTDTFMGVTLVEREAGGESWTSARDVSELLFGGGAGLERWRRWLFHCLEVSCSDFFRGALEEAKAKAAAAQKTASRSPSTSATPGSSTGSSPAANTTLA